MSNIVTGRQLRAARILAGLTQKQLAQAVGVHERAARYWELKETKAPTSRRALSRRGFRGQRAGWAGGVFAARDRQKMTRIGAF